MLKCTFSPALARYTSFTILLRPGLSPAKPYHSPGTSPHSPPCPAGRSPARSRRARSGGSCRQQGRGRRIGGGERPNRWSGRTVCPVVTARSCVSRMRSHSATRALGGLNGRRSGHHVEGLWGGNLGDPPRHAAKKSVSPRSQSGLSKRLDHGECPTAVLRPGVGSRPRVCTHLTPT
jgi:hypothetical protein